MTARARAKARQRRKQRRRWHRATLSATWVVARTAHRGRSSKAGCKNLRGECIWFCKLAGVCDVCTVVALWSCSCPRCPGAQSKTWDLGRMLYGVYACGVRRVVHHAASIVACEAVAPTTRRAPTSLEGAPLGGFGENTPVKYRSREFWRGPNHFGASRARQVRR